MRGAAAWSSNRACVLRCLHVVVRLGWCKLAQHQASPGSCFPFSLLWGPPPSSPPTNVHNGDAGDDNQDGGRDLSREPPAHVKPLDEADAWNDEQLGNLVERHRVDHERQVEREDRHVGHQRKKHHICRGWGVGVRWRRPYWGQAMRIRELHGHTHGRACESLSQAPASLPRHPAASPLRGMFVGLMNPSPCVTQTLSVHTKKCMAVNVVAAHGECRHRTSRGAGRS